MKLETAKILAVAAEKCGVEVKVFPNYRREGTYGKTTTAIAIRKQSDLLTLAKYVYDNQLMHSWQFMHELRALWFEHPNHNVTIAH